MLKWKVYGSTIDMNKGDHSRRNVITLREYGRESGGQAAQVKEHWLDEF